MNYVRWNGRSPLSSVCAEETGAIEGTLTLHIIILCGPIDRPTETLRVVTAREERVVLVCFFYVSVELMREKHHLHNHPNHEKYTFSDVEGREINFHKPRPKRNSNPGRWCEGTRTITPCARVVIRLL